MCSVCYADVALISGRIGPRRLFFVADVLFLGHSFLPFSRPPTTVHGLPDFFFLCEILPWWTRASVAPMSALNFSVEQVGLFPSVDDSRRN